LYLIWWGNNWITTAEGARWRGRLRNTYGGLTEEYGFNLTYQHILNQYYDNTGPINNVSIAGEYVETAFAAAQGQTYADVALTVEYAIEHNHWPRAPENQFIVLHPPGTVYQPAMVKDQEGEVGCGFHQEDSRGDVYGLIPDISNKEFSAKCAITNEAGEHVYAEEETETASHEYAEATTDPSGGVGHEQPAWTASQWEIADICDEGPEKVNEFLGIYVTALWGNHEAIEKGNNEGCVIKDPPEPSPPPPAVTTKAATGVAATAATVTGSVNPNGPDAHYYFEYGTTKSYGATSPTPPGNDAGFGTTAVPASATITGLQPSTTYHYRIVASTWAGTGHGTDHKFTTSARGTFSAGAYHMCALLASPGGIDCWGYNYDGELGNGTTKNISTKPVAVSGIASAREVSGGGYHTCALLSGSIDCWGYNKFGELGNGTTKGSATPVAVGGITNAIEVSGGTFYTCALLSSGGIDCWGENGFGELGDGTFTERTTPVGVAGITNATEVTAGELSTCALISGGSIKCWGYNGFGELGNGSTVPEYSPTPVAVKGITNAVAVSAVGDFHTCALLSTGSIKCWGYNEDGELGNGTITEDSTTPVLVSGIGNAAGVEAGSFFTCAWRTSAIVNCWGENYFGELGNGTTENSSTPVQVSGITTATGVTAGTSHACARLIGGGVDCWGENLDGQLGNGTTTNSSTPVAVKGLP
jgi:alpha-tubulin suppressor-like RCC1 family protein